MRTTILFTVIIMLSFYQSAQAQQTDTLSIRQQDIVFIASTTAQGELDSLKISLARGLNNGMTDPALPSTFPNRVALYFTFPWVLALCTIISHIRFVAPITLVGFTALSVDTIIKRSAPYSSQSSTRFWVPNTLLKIASTQLCSIRGTCL